MISVFSFGQNNEELIITGTNVNVRASSSTASAIVTNLLKDTKCEIIGKTQATTKIGEKTDYWYYIKYKDKTGWVFGAFTSKAQAKTKVIMTYPENKYLVISGDNVNVRENPGLSAKVVTKFSSGEVIKVIEKGNKETIGGTADYWYKIQSTQGQKGWVFGKYTIKLELYNQSAVAMYYAQYDATINDPNINGGDGIGEQLDIKKDTDGGLFVYSITTVEGWNEPLEDTIENVKIVNAHFTSTSKGYEDGFFVEAVIKVNDAAYEMNGILFINDDAFAFFRKKD